MFSTFRMSMLSRLPLAAVLAAVVPVLVTACGEPAATTTSGTATPVIIDYSPTVSDANALLYVAARPDVDLLAVTMPSTGEADCVPGAEITRSLLMVAERDGVPVGCGDEVSPDGRNEWPDEWRREANQLPGVVLPRSGDVATASAERLLTDVIGEAREPVIVLVSGPLTNIARTLDDHPELVDRIERVVVMGGAVSVDGNVEAAPAAEWNLHVDPIAARQVFESGVDVLLVPLDVTNRLPWTPQLVSRLGVSEHEVARTAHQIVSGRTSLDGIFLWDELAAIVALDPSVVTTEAMRLAVDAAGALTLDPAAAVVDVAVAVDAEAATSELLRTLNGSETMHFGELTAGEAAYFDALVTMSERIGRRFTEDGAAPPSSAGAVELARLLVETFWAGLTELRDGLVALEPPTSLTGEHATFLAAVDAAVVLEGDLLAEIAASHGDDPWAIVERAMHEIAPTMLPGVIDACEQIERHALVRGGPAVCELFGE